MASELSDIPHNMRRLYRRFERWRSAHTGRLPIPERLWAAATELAREHGVFPTAKALHLEYGKLKQLADVPVPALKGGWRRGRPPLDKLQAVCAVELRCCAAPDHSLDRQRLWSWSRRRPAVPPSAEWSWKAHAAG